MSRQDGPMRKLAILPLIGSKVVWALLCGDTVSAQTADRNIEATLLASAPVVKTAALQQGTSARSIERAVDRQGRHLRLSATSNHSRFQVQPAPAKRNWIRRHPAVFGALVGFGGGFFVGYLAGDDAVFDDFTKGFHGVVFGGAGALAGAIIGELTLTSPADNTP